MRVTTVLRILARLKAQNTRVSGFELGADLISDVIFYSCT
jgi:hypothetical protein